MNDTADARAGGPGPPSLALFLVEGQRAFFESLTLFPTDGLLRRAPRGDGHPVLVLPGFSADDASTGALRRYLTLQGYSAHPWLCGRNLGAPGFLRERLIDRVEELFARHDRKITLVGWSLGGIYARELAKRMPRYVRQVITLGSPFADGGQGTNVTRLFELMSGRELSAERAQLFETLRVPPPDVPSTAIVSKTDGIAHWRACIEPETDLTENIFVPGSHCGLGFNPLVHWAIANRLSQPEGDWQPFDPAGWERLIYSRAQRAEPAGARLRAPTRSARCDPAGDCAQVAIAEVP